MTKDREVRIILRPRPDGSAEISVYDPQTGREDRTGMVARADAVDKEVRGLKTTLERAGSRVTVVNFK